jgi:RNA polymerase sigma factor (sigma-70 family)
MNIVVTAQTLISDNEEKLLRQFEALAFRIARAYHAKYSHTHELEELAQVARLGILGAIRTFDPDRKTVFITHAYNSARFAVSKHVRKTTGVLRIPYKNSQPQDHTVTILPLHEAVIPEDESVMDDSHKRVELSRLMEILSDDERDVFWKMNALEMTSKEVAAETQGMTAHRVLQLNRSAMRKVREMATKEGIAL